MKLALLGTGKTGQKVQQLFKHHDKDGELFSFNSSSRPKLEQLRQADCVLSFLPADAFLEYLELFFAAKRPMVIGTTGIEWPSGTQAIRERLEGLQMTWIHGHNFALGMILIKELLERMKSVSRLNAQYSYQLHEKHHKHKKDAPSGTALKWRQWLDAPQAPIASEREGDIVGEHSLTLSLPFEEITLTHKALDRSVFAQGALWACDLIVSQKLSPGLYAFEDLAAKALETP